MRDGERQAVKKVVKGSFSLDARGVTKQHGQGWGLYSRKHLFLLIVPERRVTQRQRAKSSNKAWRFLGHLGCVFLSLWMPHLLPYLGHLECVFLSLWTPHLLPVPRRLQERQVIRAKLQ